MVTFLDAYTNTHVCLKMYFAASQTPRTKQVCLRDNYVDKLLLIIKRTISMLPR